MLTLVQQQSAQEELRKVLQMACQGIEVQMFSRAIDSVWHSLLESRNEYNAFSIAACGTIIGHRGGHKNGVVNFIESYERRWGELPNIWFVDENGYFDKDAYQEYIGTGIVQASWNCQATHNCTDIYKNDPRPDRSRIPSPSDGTPKPPIQNPVKPNAPSLPN
ncbi:TPA: hypothetical protein QHU55_002537 [Klebsiella aerogenes]|uniref:hypothetical protein n=1 Tax=Klebsiella aerogenes TaxID=548 RepID=UPI001866A0E4|nr:hypothetical protein [Klebsiella aerogenes]HDS2562922.1 hypothetical protein [Klebsiella aerogenes]HDS6533985.1 hypothetical protein [Klebsiella aerogenes]HDS7500247.1 hypothetical protein [Klebsiella aerogenes]HDS9641897.1 hypothetical protein [Klebsiella aerogenes]HDT0788027.1 hypothetical protein [Klebsiella aerogenes]